MGVRFLCISYTSVKLDFKKLCCPPQCLRTPWVPVTIVAVSGHFQAWCTQSTQMDTLHHGYLEDKGLDTRPPQAWQWLQGCTVAMAGPWGSVGTAG